MIKKLKDKKNLFKYLARKQQNNNLQNNFVILWEKLFLWYAMHCN